MSGDRYFINDQNALYFLTFTVVDWLDIFIRPAYKQIIVNDLNYCIAEKGMEVFAWCLMTSHLHLIAKAKDGYKLSNIIRDLKKHTANSTLKAINLEHESRKEWLLDRLQWRGKQDKRITNYAFWKPDNHAIYLDMSQPKILDQKVDYIHQNPVKDMIVNEAEEYIYSSAVDYSGGKGLVKISYF